MLGFGNFPPASGTFHRLREFSTGFGNFPPASGIFQPQIQAIFASLTQKQRLKKIEILFSFCMKGIFQEQQNTTNPLKKQPKPRNH
jgi:hypothetical protein